VEKEFETLELGSKRLERRFKVAVSDLSEHPEESIWLASGSRANAKAVYRMLGNERLDKEGILAAHRNTVCERNEEKILLAIQDTMCVNYDTHGMTEGLGYNCEQSLGLNVHSCLYVTPQGIPIGLAAQSALTRLTKSDERSHHEKRMRNIEEKESFRWLQTMREAAQNAPANVKLVHIADREGDIYELYAAAEKTGQTFVIRAIHDRLTVGNQHMLEALDQSEIKGSVNILVPENHNKHTKERHAVLQLRYMSLQIRKPQIRNTNKELADSLTLNLISLKETDPPNGQGPIEWLLMTNFELNSYDQVLRVIEYYRQRWKIERFHFVLKSGCEIEKIQQHSVDRIELMILMYSIISIHIMQLTYIARCFPDTPCSLIFSENEWKTLYRAAKLTTIVPDMPYSMADAANFVAILGGRTAAPSDGPPGLKVIWLGLNALFLLNHYRDYI